jgi:serine-type D-Ala-D-Ala carboxypeptidase (penicillin-binding protein 5/6)
MNRRIIIMLVILLIQMVTIEPIQAEEIKLPKISSEAAIVIDPATNTVLYEKNASEQLYPASLTKIATAIYAIENGNLEDLVTISENAYRTMGSTVYLEKGEQLSLKQLLEGLLINSGNDAAIAIAEHLSGSVAEFSNELNTYLQDVIGVKQTHFKNPHGLFDVEHVTTAENLAVITKYAMENEVFSEIFGTKEIQWESKGWDTTLYTHHKLLREMPYPGVTGGKTGYVEEAGFTLATTASRDNMSLVVITMGNAHQLDVYQDTKALLDYGFEHFTRDGEAVTIRNDRQIKLRKLDNIKKLKGEDGKSTSGYAVLSNSKEALTANRKELRKMTKIHHDVALDFLLLGSVLLFIWLKLYRQKSQKS